MKNMQNTTCDGDFGFMFLVLMQYLLLSNPPNLNTTTNAVGFDIYMTLQ